MHISDKDSNAIYIKSSYKSIRKQLKRMAKSWRSNSEILYPKANKYTKIIIIHQGMLLLLFIREMKIKPHLCPFSILSESVWLGEYDLRREGKIMTVSRKISD